MTLLKSQTNSNFAAIQTVQIILNNNILSIPNKQFFNQSSIKPKTGTGFEKIEITDGSYNIKTINNSHGTIFQIEGSFKHPKVRLTATNFFSTFLSKKIRLLIVDNNNIARLTPPLILSVSENIPDLPNYNGYIVSFDAKDEIIPFINLDGPWIQPTVTWSEIFDNTKFCFFNSVSGINEGYIKFIGNDLVSQVLIEYEVDGVICSLNNSDADYSNRYTLNINCSSYLKIITITNCSVIEFSLPFMNIGNPNFNIPNFAKLVGTTGSVYPIIIHLTYNKMTDLQIEKFFSWANGYHPAYGIIGNIFLHYIDRQYTYDIQHGINYLIASGVTIHENTNY